MTHEPALPVFRSPAEVAPDLGLPKTAVRSYALESGHHTRVGKGKIVLDEGHVQDLIVWIRNRNNSKADRVKEPEVDPFA